VLAISARSVENPSDAGVEVGGVVEVVEPGSEEGGDMTGVVVEKTGVGVAGRLEAAWGASSRLSVDSPKLRLEAAAEV